MVIVTRTSFLSVIKVGLVLLVLFLTGSVSAFSSTSRSSTKFGVVSYVSNKLEERHLDSEQTILDFMLGNVANYESFIAMASIKDVDLLIFPEYGLTSLTLLSLPLRKAELFMLLFHWSQDTHLPIFSPDNVVIRRLSEAAKRNNMYVVVDVGAKEVTTGKNFNMAIAFDRVGNIVACYRKQHLYGEEHLMSRPEAYWNTEGKFETDFGSKVQMLICFDLLYNTQLGSDIDIVAFPTAWNYELPFLSAVQTQSGWARVHDVLVLAANVVELDSGHLGSGIYSGHGIIIYNNDPFTVSPGALLVVDGHEGDKCDTDDTEKEKERDNDRWYAEHFLKENLTEYHFVSLETKNGPKVMQLANCRLIYWANLERSSGSSSYLLVSRRGTRTFGNGQYAMEIEVCGLIFCVNKFLPDVCEPPQRSEASSFNFISLAMMDKSQEVMAMPLTLRLDLLTPILNFDYYHHDNQVVIDVNERVDDLYSIALFTPMLDDDDMENDPPYESSATTLH